MMLDLKNGILTPEEYKKLLEDVKNSRGILEVAAGVNQMLELCMEALHAIAIYDEASEVSQYAKSVIDVIGKCGHGEEYEVPRLG